MFFCYKEKHFSFQISTETNANRSEATPLERAQEKHRLQSSKQYINMILEEYLTQTFVMRLGIFAC